jgi:hypothetical protein
VFVAPGEDRLVEAAAGGPLPLGLGRQLLVCPGGVRLGVLVGYVHVVADREALRRAADADRISA